MIKREIRIFKANKIEIPLCILIKRTIIIYNTGKTHNVDNIAEIYVSKVTAAGQISLPKPLRDALGIREDYIVIEPFWDALILRKVKSLRDELFGNFEKEAKNKGITREQLERAIKKSGKKLLREIYNVKTRIFF